MGTYALDSTIFVDKAVGIYGGFIGWETEIEERDWQSNVTKVDGQYEPYSEPAKQYYFVTADGAYWSAPYGSVQEAIDAASEDYEDWVKMGTLTLDATIYVDKAAGIYGDFAGGETEIDQRVWQSNVDTVDEMYEYSLVPGPGEHCFYVTADATLDGLNITRCPRAISTTIAPFQ